MGVTICIHHPSSSRHDDLLWDLSDREYDELSPVFAIYKRRTGIVFDEYRDTTLPRGTLGPLRESVQEALLVEPVKSKADLYHRLLALVERAEREDFGLAFVGD